MHATFNILRFPVAVALMALLSILVASVILVGPAGAHHKSTDSSLKSFTVDVAFSPAFTPSTTHYTAQAQPKATTEITVIATPNDSNASGVYYGPTDADPNKRGHQYNLKLGQNDFYINVYAEDDRHSTEYRLSVYRNTESVEPSLSSLSVSQDIHPNFDSATREYVSYVWNGVDEITVSAELTDDTGSIDYGTTDADSGDDGHQYELNVGRNDLSIVVYGADPKASNTYTITVWRHPDVDFLIENRGGSSSSTALTMTTDNWYQRFTTGPSAQGYTITSLRLSLSGPSGENLDKVEIIEFASGAVVGTFFVNLPGNSNKWIIFYATEPFHLQPNNKYMVHINKPETSGWSVDAKGNLRNGALSGSYYGWSGFNRICTNRKCTSHLSNRAMIRFQIRGFPVDDTGPRVVRAESKARAIFLTFDERLDDDDRVPPSNSFDITDGNDASLDIHEVHVKGRQVRVLTNDVIDFDETVKVSYSPGSKSIRDVARNDLAAFSDLSVRTALTTIDVDGVQASFPDNQWRYQATVPNSTEWATISVTSRNPANYLLMRVTHADRGGNGSISGKHKLQVGRNRLVIRVWDRCCPLPEHEEPMVHILHINRAP